MKSIPFGVIEIAGNKFIKSELVISDGGNILIDYNQPYQKLEEVEEKDDNCKSR